MEDGFILFKNILSIEYINEGIECIREDIIIIIMLKR